MDRKFLKELGLEDEVVEKVMTEHGKSLKVDKETIDLVDQLNKEKTDLEKSLAGVQSEKESLSEKLATAESDIQTYADEASKYKTQNLRYGVAAKNNIPFDLADRLQGDDEESLQADAERLAKYVSIKDPAPMKSYDNEPKGTDAALMSMLDNMNI